jgi:hypothetical protein
MDSTLYVQYRQCLRAVRLMKNILPTLDKRCRALLPSLLLITQDKNKCTYLIMHTDTFAHNETIELCLRT